MVGSRVKGTKTAESCGLVANEIGAKRVDDNELETIRKLRKRAQPVQQRDKSFFNFSSICDSRFSLQLSRIQRSFPIQPSILVISTPFGASTF